MSGRRLRRLVRLHVESMGGSPGEVAGRLASEGVRGVPAEVTDCVLARYLKAVVGAETAVRRIVVKERSVRMYRRGYPFPVVVPLPGSVSRFIRAFDAGCYPELIDAASVAQRGPRPGVAGPPSPGGSSGSHMDLFS